jgi:hypothetical protein
VSGPVLWALGPLPHCCLRLSSLGWRKVWSSDIRLLLGQMSAANLPGLAFNFFFVVPSFFLILKIALNLFLHLF